VAHREVVGRVASLHEVVHQATVGRRASTGRRAKTGSPTQQTSAAMGPLWQRRQEPEHSNQRGLRPAVAPLAAAAGKDREPVGDRVAARRCPSEARRRAAACRLGQAVGGGASQRHLAVVAYRLGCGSQEGQFRSLEAPSGEEEEEDYRCGGDDQTQAEEGNVHCSCAMTEVVLRTTSEAAPSAPTSHRCRVEACSAAAHANQ